MIRVFSQSLMDGEKVDIKEAWDWCWWRSSTKWLLGVWRERERENHWKEAILASPENQSSRAFWCVLDMMFRWAIVKAELMRHFPFVAKDESEPTYNETYDGHSSRHLTVKGPWGSRVHQLHQDLTTCLHTQERPASCFELYVCKYHTWYNSFYSIKNLRNK